MQRVIKNSLFTGLLSIIAFFGIALNVNAAELDPVLGGDSPSLGAAPKQVQLVVRYFDEQGNTLAPNLVETHYEGESYSVTAPERIDGYKLVRTPPVTSGTFGKGNIYLDFFYGKYQLSFETNGGTPVDTIERTYGDSVDLSDYSSEKEGYEFDSWNTKADGSGNEFTEWQAKRDRTVYAKWNLLEYNIAYELNGASIEGDLPLTYNVESGDIMIPNPVLDGYKFIGWTGTDLTEPMIDLIISHGSTGNKVFTANFLKQVKLIVNYYDHEGNPIHAPTETEYLEGDHYEATPLEFKNRMLDTDRLPDNETGDFGEDDVNVDYYYNSVRTLTFETNGGTPIEPLVSEYGTEVDLSNYVPEREGYSFAGWYTTEELSEPITVWKSKMNRTIYAKWTIDTHTLTFETNGGTPIDEIEREYGTRVDLSEYVPEREGFDFAGWSSKEDLSNDFTVWQAKRDRTVYAKWTPITHTLTFETNGGEPIEALVEEYGTRVKLSDYVPTREGYDFEGWFLDSDLTKKFNVWQAKMDRTVYAKWVPTEYTISYDLDGGEAENPETYTVESDDITLVAPVKEGFKFIGWTGTDLDEPTLEVTIPSGTTGDLEYVANYVEVHTLTFETNGGTPIDSIESEYGTIVDLSNYVPEREGYEFAGWSSKADLSDSFTVWKSKITRTIYAKWTLIEYTISYDLDGGEAENPTTYTVESEDITLEAPVKEGFKFIGWTGSNGDEPTLEVTIPSGTTGDLEYVANYVELHTLTFESNGGTPIDSIESEYGTIVDLSNYVPERDGYRFDGWSSKEDLSDSFTVWKSKIDRTVYAKWALIKYTITYDLDGGEANNPESYFVESDDITLEAPEKEGYVFIGWTGSNGDEPELEVTIETGTTGNLEFTANYEREVHTLTFESNGGTPIDSIEKEYGTKVDLSEYVPEREGYEFAGWSSKEDLSDDFSTWRAKRDRTVYAKWNLIEYTISYDLDGGEAENPTTYTIESEDITLVAPEKEGYEFIGWTGSNGEEPELEVTIEAGTTGDLSYVANYLKKVQLIIRYFDNQGNSIAEEVVADYLEGDFYFATTIKTVDGYVINLTRLPRNVRGRFETEDIYVDYYYNKLCTLTFETNGGSTINPRENIVENSIVQLLTYNPTRLGYRFGGWFRNADLSGSRIYLVRVTDDTTVYAKWIPIVYNISYDLDGGEAENPTTYTIESEDITLVAPEKEGYEFIGWTGSNGEEPELVVVIPQGSTGNLSYVANYLKKVKLIVRYLDNQDNPLSDETVIDYLENDQWEAPEAISVNGYVLNEGRLPVTDGTFATEDVYVDYYYNKLCVLTFNTNGGSIVPAIPDIVEGTDIDLTTIVPVLKYNEFKGWYLEPELTNLVTLINVVDDTTLYAKWKFIYEILAGENQTHIQDIDGGLIIVCNGYVERLVGIEVDGQMIDASNYSIVSGSTILTLTKDYLNSLSLGDHDVRFVYEDGSASTKFKIDKLPETQTASVDAISYASKNPQTGDNIILYVIMLIISMLSLTFVSKEALVNKA